MHKKIISYGLLSLASIWVFFGLSVLIGSAANSWYHVSEVPSPYWRDWGWQYDWVPHASSLKDFLPNRVALVAMYFSLLFYLSSYIGKRFLIEGESSALDKVLQPIWGLVPLYLMMCGFNRLVSLFFHAKLASKIILLTLLISTVLAYLENRKQKSEYLIHSITFFILAFFAILTVQFGSAFIIGDATLREVSAIALGPEYGINTNTYFPIVSYHYDEIAFLLPVFYATSRLNVAVELLLPVWVMHWMVKAGAFSLTYFCIRIFKVATLPSLALVSLLFFGALSFHPEHRLYLFDSASPVFYVLHPGRAISSLYVLWVIAVCHFIQQHSCRHKVILLGAVSLLGVGISSVGIQTPLGIIVLVLLCVWITPLVSPFRYTLVNAVAVSSLFLPIAYLNFEQYSTWGGIPLAVGILLATSALIFEAVRNRQPISWRPYALALLLSIVFGFFVGNILVKVIAPEALLVTKGVLPPPEVYMNTGNALFSPGKFQGLHWPTGHQIDFANFSARYGLPIVLALMLAILFIQSKANYLLINPLLIALMFFITGLFLMDFVKVDNNFAGMTWEYARQFAVRTRLVEGGYYGVIAFSLIGLMSSDIKVVRGLTFTLMCIFLIVPTVQPKASIFTQFCKNFLYILGR